MGREEFQAEFRWLQPDHFRLVGHRVFCIDEDHPRRDDDAGRKHDARASIREVANPAVHGIGAFTVDDLGPEDNPLPRRRPLLDGRQFRRIPIGLERL